MIDVAGRKSIKCIGVVNTQLKIEDYEMPETFPFCIVEDHCLTTCVLIGLNFLSDFGLTLNYNQCKLTFNEDVNVRLKSCMLDTMTNIEVTSSNSESENDASKQS